MGGGRKIKNSNSQGNQYHAQILFDWQNLLMPSFNVKRRIIAKKTAEQQNKSKPQKKKKTKQNKTN